jgi:hypothetical protein
MKKTYLFALLALMVIVVIIFWWKPQKGVVVLDPVVEHTEVVPPSEESSNGNQTSNTEKLSPETQLEPGTSNVVGNVSTEDIRKYMESQNVPVDFHGKVVDQDDSPLSGVRVMARVRHWNVVAPIAFGAHGKSLVIDKETGSDGYFKFDGVTGDVLGIESVSKPSYELEPYTLRNYSVASGSFDNPVIFKMWNTNIQERLISGSKSYRITSDGKSYFIDFAKGEVTDTSEGDLRVRIKYATDIVPGQTNDWSCEIAPVNGGLLEETNRNSSMYLAPTGGYTSTFQLSYPLKSGQRGSSGERRFYVKLKNGQEYGRIIIELFAPYNVIPGLVRVQYAINPSGSRILR